MKVHSLSFTLAVSVASCGGACGPSHPKDKTPSREAKKQEPAAVAVDAGVEAVVALEAGAPEDQMPTMAYDQFLPEVSDEKERSELWSYFRAAEREAKKFAGTPERWVVIKKVEIGKGPHWGASGKIVITPKSGAGTLFHEIFHTAFQKSVFHPDPKEQAWEEGFCDAFRYAAEHDLVQGPPSDWASHIQKLTAMTYEEALASSKDHGLLKAYRFPASRIVKKSGGTLEGMRRMWFELTEKRNQTGRAVFDEYFGWAAKEIRGR